MAPISVLILALNEEANLPRCLESVQWSDDVVILDDGSTDRTIEIAETYGARVIKHSAGGERAQRTYSLREIEFKNPWVYNPDADEVTTPGLRDEMLAAAADSSRPEVAYRVRFKVMFMGRWIKHSSLYPTWVVRLFKPDRISFSRDINLHYDVDGPVGYLKHHFEHYSFNKGLHHWFEKHNRYSTHEAEQALKERTGRIPLRDLVSRFPDKRRRALKRLAWRMPLRSYAVFVYLYLVRLGFLDGRAGFNYCTLRFIYETMIDLKVKELRRGQRGKC